MGGQKRKRYQLYISQVENYTHLEIVVRTYTTFRKKRLISSIPKKRSVVQSFTKYRYGALKHITYPKIEGRKGKRDRFPDDFTR